MPYVPINTTGIVVSKEMIEFTHNAIRNLRTGKWSGIHSVYSGYNDALVAKFNLPKHAKFYTTKMAEMGAIEVAGATDGVTLYLPGENPRTNGASKDARTAATIAKIEGKPTTILRKGDVSKTAKTDADVLKDLGL